jgi:hypothetical protein
VSPPVTPTTTIAATLDDCGLAAARDFETQGDLDAALAAISRCREPPPPVLAARMELLVVLGDIEEAKLDAARLAAAVPSHAPRAAEIQAMPPADRRLADARALAREGVAARDRGDTIVATRKLAMARHLYRRLAGAEPEPTLLSGGSSFGWTGNAPLYSLVAHRFPIGGERSGVVAVGALDPETHEVELTSLVDASDDYQPWSAWPGHSGAVAVAAKAGSVIVGAPGKPRRLDATGVVTFSSRGDLLAIATPTALVTYDTATWTKISDLPVKAKGRGAWLSGGSIYAEVGPEHEHVLVADVREGRVILDEEEISADALSASNAYLAVLRYRVVPNPDRLVYYVDLRAVDALDKPRLIRLDISMFHGRPTLQFVGDRRLVVGERFSVAHGDYEEVEHAVIDVASGAVRRGAGDVRGGPHFVRTERAAYAKLSKTVGPFVPKPRVLAETAQFTWPYATSSSAPDRLAPGSASIVAATAGTPGRGCGSVGADCFLSEPSVMLVAEAAHRKSLLHDVKIPLASIAMKLVTFTPDEATVFACGYEETGATHGFVIDVASGQIGATPPTDCVYRALDEKGVLLLLEGGVVDLRHHAGRSWPLLFQTSWAPFDAAQVYRDRTALPEGTPGLVCRFGELVAPFAVCPR